MSNVIVERFSLISFHRTDLATHLVIVPCSERIWKIRPEVDDLERVYSQPSRFLTSATELAKFAGLSGADRKDNFFLWPRRDVKNLIEASYQVEFSSLGYRVEHNRESRRWDPFTHDHEFSHSTGGKRDLFLFSLSRQCTPALFPPFTQFSRSLPATDIETSSALPVSFRRAKYLP